MSLEALAADIRARAQGRARFVFAVAGPPGAGKSTLAAALVTRLDALMPGEVALMPMDGYHLDNAVLVERGLLARKGAPETFDVEGFACDLDRLRAGGREVLVPVFDRTLDLARAGARAIRPGHRVVVIEGNYLLLDRPPWQALAPAFDRTLFISVPREELLRRLVERWLAHDLDPAAARARAEGNDLVNADLVTTASRPADLLWREGEMQQA